MKHAVKMKRKHYRELVESPNYGFLVVACETGGRWNDAARRLVSALVKHKTSADPPLLRRAAALGWHRRWWSILSIAAQTALADSLMPRHVFMPNPPAEGATPPLHEVLSLAGDPPVPSRLGLR